MLAATVPICAQAFIIDGRVAAVESGDTLVLINRRKVRHVVKLAGVAAPELGQAFGNAARDYLANLVYGKNIKAMGRRFDDAGRLRGKILLGGRDINLEMIVAGFAWHHTEIPAEQIRTDGRLYEAAESHARRSKFNLWSEANPTPPWIFKAKVSASR
jgi:endonuclease YncB( thermonuclease family)